MKLLVKYQMAHMRVYQLWGPARSHPCVTCGQPAEHWAYDGTDPGEQRGTGRWNGLPYSSWPEFYMPMCVKHHRQHDAKGRTPCSRCGLEGHAKGLCKKHYDDDRRDRHNELRRLRRQRQRLVSA